MIGREAELERTMQILSRRSKNNPILIGPAGVGKTAIAEGLALRIIEGRVPENLRSYRVVSLEAALLTAGTKFRGDFEERLKMIMQEITGIPGIVIFIDEIHTLLNVGGAEGSIDAANLFKPMLARGEFQCIGATTLDEYHRIIEADPALERRFQPVQVAETDFQPWMRSTKPMLVYKYINQLLNIISCNDVMRSSYSNARKSMPLLIGIFLKPLVCSSVSVNCNKNYGWVNRIDGVPCNAILL